MYKDPYIQKYQEVFAHKIKILQKDEKTIDAYLSLQSSTRSTYDIAMRDATIDGLITMNDINLLKPSQIFYKTEIPNELYILQSVNRNELQVNSMNINAIKQNSFITVKRQQYDEELGEEVLKEIYIDIISFVAIMNKDEKNFAAGIENNTVYNIQIPKKDIHDEFYILKHNDTVILKDISNSLDKIIKIESIDEFGVPGIIRIYGTIDTRNDK